MIWFAFGIFLGIVLPGLVQEVCWKVENMWFWRKYGLCDRLADDVKWMADEEGK